MSETSAQRSPLLPQLSECKPSGVSANMSNQDSVALVLDPGTTQIIKKPRLAGWKLKYQDILPAYNRKNGGSPSDPHETFQSLVDRANDWMKKNTDVAVKTCETLTWHSHDAKKLGDSELMVLSKRVTQNSENHFLRGLRLWLVPQTSNGRTQQQTICYCDYLPEGNDNIQSLVNRANRKIDSGALKGEVLTVETVGVPLINGNLDSGDTRWTESINDDSPYVFCLRVFYNKQKDKKANIGLKDIVPMLSAEDGYEGFPELCERANTWLKDQSDVLIVSMQSLMVQKDDGPHSETGSACYFTIPGILSEHSAEFFRILRVTYIKPSGEQVTEIPMIYPFTYEVFTPEIVTKGTGDKTKERMEKMKECYSRVHSHLKATGKGRGADIICVETVLNPMQLVQVDNAQNEDMKFLLTLRLYLTAQIGGYEGDIKAMISQRASLNVKPRKLSHDDGAPGPIFLGNVVRREFRYRWLVLAVTVFTCMTIIVVVSVVYSNT